MKLNNTLTKSSYNYASVILTILLCSEGEAATFEPKMIVSFKLTDTSLAALLAATSKSSGILSQAG